MVLAKKILLEKHKDITRIDQESKRTHGWYVRVRYCGETYSKFFSDKKNGGRYSSLLASLAWRDKTEIDLGKVRTDRHMVTVSNTLTGVVGVRLNDKLHRYEVSWVNKDGRQGKTSVSILKHGKKKAFELACKKRAEKEGAIPDALFKIVIKEKEGGVDVLAFLIPNILPKGEKDLDKFLVSVDRVEELTGLDFLTVLLPDVQEQIEGSKAEGISW